MNKWMKAYASFTRTERMGIIALLFIIAILIGIKTTMHLWVKPDFNTAEEQQLQHKWEEYKKKAQDDTAQPLSTTNNLIDTTATAISLTPFMFDPNTINEEELKQLGLQVRTIRIFLNWRSKGKHFYKKEDLRSLYTLSDAAYRQLAPYIQIKTDKINLNIADSATLVSLPGIGAKLAHKILDYKKEIGKYKNIDQLRDVYHFSDENTINAP